MYDPPPLSPAHAGNSRQMNRPKLRGAARAGAAALAMTTCVLLGGCVHRPYIQQGNYLETEDVDQVSNGMTRSQVRYLLGTPMISDPFTAQRWDYIYTLKRGRARKIDRAHFVVYFADDKVTRIEKLDAPEPQRGGLETGLPEVEREALEDAKSPEKDEEKQEPEPEAPKPEGS
jgi:outer membrane protein assembly factor BamE